MPVYTAVIHGSVPNKVLEPSSSALSLSALVMMHCHAKDAYWVDADVADVEESVHGIPIKRYISPVPNTELGLVQATIYQAIEHPLPFDDSDLAVVKVRFEGLFV